MKIKIGADELILWLRKNELAEKETNIQLGLKILNLIESLGGNLFVHDEQCYWHIEPPYPEFINEYKLPKTASQYYIDSNKIGDLYITLSSWV
jgi:hypothetical protein